VRLTTDAPNLQRRAAELIAWYLSPERHPAGQAWSRKHTHTQQQLCQRFLLPVLGDVACQDILVAHTQRALNAAPTAGEGARLRRCISALVSAGLAGGWLVNVRLKEVHSQSGGREVPAARGHAGGEAAQYVDPAEIPGPADVAKLGQTLALLKDQYELMVAARVRAVAQEQAAGLNLLGLMFPAPAGGYLRSSNFNRRALRATYRVAAWRDADGRGDWTWHSLRHVFCTTALYTWKMDVVDVSRLAGHSSYRVTIDMYIGNMAGTLDRAYLATG
jgi:hypothetical protein